MSDDDAAAIVREFQLLRDAVRALPAAIAAAMQTQAGTALSRADRDALSAYLSTIVTPSLPRFCFTAAEALQHLQSSPLMLAAMAPAIGSPASTRKLGKLFARAEGVVIDGRMLAREGPLRDGVLWSAVRVDI